MALSCQQHSESKKPMNHNPNFLARVNQARRGICECTVDELIQARNEGKSFTLIDVREESEFSAGHIPGAIHLSKGVIERDIESAISGQDERLVLYCGGGYRSAIAAESLVAMGYTNVTSMDGGWRGWMDAEQPVER